MKHQYTTSDLMKPISTINRSTAMMIRLLQMIVSFLKLATQPKVLALAALILFGVFKGNARVLYLVTPGSPHLAASWNTTIGGGGTPGTNFITAGDTFNIPVGVNGIFGTSMSFGGTTGTINVAVIINGTATISNGATITLANKNGLTSMTVNGTIAFEGTGTQLTGSTGGNGSSTFTLSSGATLKTSSTTGITSGAAGTSINSTEIIPVTLNPGAHYEFNGTANQATTGLPTGITGSIIINNTGTAGNNTVTLSAAQLTGNGGTLSLISGIFANGTNLTFGSTTIVIVEGGSLASAIQGTGSYNLNYVGNSKSTGQEALNSGLNNLSINLNSGQTLTATSATTLSTTGRLTLANGYFVTSFIVTLNNTAADAVTGGSSTAFISGPLKWTLPASLATGSSYIFPIGKGTSYYPFTLQNPTTGTGTVTAQAEAFPSNPAGTAVAPMTSISNTEYWQLTTTGNFTNSSISIQRPTTISPLNTIGGSTAANGSYSTLSGTAGIDGVTSSSLIGSNRFFAFGALPSITTSPVAGSPFCAGASVSVSFTIGGTFNVGNIFTAQLSDASGNFSSPTTIGSVTSTTATPISATIPSNTGNGSGYRIRVISSNPAISGSDNGSNLTIHKLPTLTTTGTIATICFSAGAHTDSLTYSASTEAPTSYYIDWNNTANTAGLLDQGTTSFSFAGAGGTINNIAISAGAQAGTYNGILTFTNGTCSNTQAVTLTISANPTITTSGTLTAACFSGSSQTASLTYTATTNSPTSYSIDWNGTANTAGLADQGTTLFSFAGGGGTINTIAITANTPAATYSGILTLTNASGCTTTQAISITVNAKPTITTTGTISAVCFNSGSQTSSLVYSATTESPTSYSIDWDATANATGLADQTSTAFSFAGSGGTISTIAVTANAPAGTYLGTMTITNGTCTNTQAISITINPSPTITLGTNPTVCGGLTGASLPYISTTGNPNQYSIVWSGAAITAGFVNVTNATLASSSIALNVPAGAAAATYTATISVSNSTTTCTSTTYAFSVTVGRVLLTPTITQPTCYSAGGISLATSGGKLPYTYDWADIIGVGNAEDRTGLLAGSYSVTVTDANGCTASSGSQTLTAATGCDGLIVCKSDAASKLSVTPDPKNDTYDWTIVGVSDALSYTNKITAGQNSPSVTIDWTTVPVGAYTVSVVADNANCNAATAKTQLVYVTEPNVSVTSDAVCLGSNLTLYASGGDNYSWTGPNLFTSQSSNPIIYGVSAANNGLYTAIITDVNGCQKSASVNVTAKAVPSISSFNITAASCGLSTGAIDVVSTGGTMFSWSNGANTEDITSVSSGNYTLVVANNDGCTTTATYAVQNSNGPQITAITPSNISCNAGANGSIIIAVSNVTSPTYAWTGPNGYTSTAQNPAGLLAGNYGVTVTSAGCASTASARITQPNPIQVDGVTTNVNCVSGTTGAINITASGGTGAFTYDWGSGVTSEDRTNLSSGIYNVTVSDASSCISSVGFTLTEPAVALTATPTITQVSCNGDNDGQVTLAVSGGTAPYTYAWTGTSFTATTKDISGRVAGDYEVTITDAKGCTFSLAGGTKVVITQPTILSASITKTDISCNGGIDGSIILSSPTGGYGTFEYQLGTGSWQPTGSYTGLTEGTYTLKIRDAAHTGCVVSLADQTITKPAVLSATVTKTNITCTDANNGNITLSLPTGGHTLYDYRLNTGSWRSSLTFDSLSVGTYSVQIRDASQTACIISLGDQTFANPTPVSIAASVTNIDCRGNLSGGIDITATGGAGSYTYQWSSADTTMEDRTAIKAGTYSVTVKDANLCSATANYTLTEPTTLTVSTSKQDMSCNTGNDGSITVTPSGGTSPYNYVWSGASSATSKDLAGLADGTYTVTVIDAKSCSTSTTVIITKPALIVPSTTAYNSLCYNGTTGSVDLTVTGGTAPLSYSWSNGATTEDITNVRAGNYTVTITDAKGCTASTSATVGQPTPIVVNATVTNVSCFGGTTGSITLSVTGGVGPYTFDWDDIPLNDNDQDRTTLAAGSYRVNVKDANGCSQLATVVVTAPSVLSVTVSTTDRNCSTPNGSATAAVSGGTSPYTYTWTGGGITSGISGLNNGSYTVTVTDAKGCTASNSGTVSIPACSPPVANDDAFTTAFNTPIVNASVAGNDFDPVFSVLSFTVLTTPTLAQGTLNWSSSNDGMFTFTPNSTYTGTFTFTYRLTNPQGGADTATVTITVVPLPTTASNVSKSKCLADNNGQVTLAGNTPTTGTGTWSVTSGPSTSAAQFSDVTNPTATFTPAAGGGNYFVRWTIANAPSPSSYADATITIDSLINNNTISSDQTICLGSTPTPLAGTTPTGGSLSDYEYRWESSTTSAAAGFATASGTSNTSGYTPGALTEDTWYRRVVISGTCANNTSAAVKITVNPTTVGGTLASDTTVCSGTNSKVLTLSGHTGSIARWQSSTASDFSAGLTDISNTTTSYTATNLTVTTYFRAVLKSGICDSAVSATATITVQSALANNTITGAQTICSGASATILTGSTPTGGNATYTYQWQSSTSSATTGFSNIATTQNFTPGVLTDTTYFRRYVSSGSCAIADTSSPVTIIVNPLPTITLDGVAAVNSAATSFSIVYSATTGGVNQYSITAIGPGAMPGFSNVPFTPLTSSPIVVTIPTTPNGTYKFIVIVRNNSTGCISLGDTISLLVSNIYPGIISAPQTICAGTAPVAFQVDSPANGLGTITYFWQQSTLSAVSGFNTIPLSTSETYTAGTLTQSTWFRRGTTNGTDSGYTSAVKITIIPASVGGTASGTDSVCTGSNATTFNLSGNVGSVIRWESAADTAFTTSTPIANTTTSLTVTGLTSTTYYRAVVQSGTCATDNSDTAAVFVSPASVGGTTSGTATVCTGTNATTVSLASYVGSVIRWESSADSAFTTPTPIANPSNTLLVENLTSTTYYRAVVKSGACDTDTSTIVKITVDTVIVNNIITTAQTICSGRVPNALTGSTPTGGDRTAFSYAWLTSTTSASAGFSPISGANSTNYAPAALTQATWFKRVVTSGMCAMDTSAAVKITVNDSITNAVAQTACDSFVWNGTTYHTSGSFVKTLTRTNGCDSVVTLDLTINHPTTSSQSLSACDSLVWNGTTYTASGTYTYHTTNAAGCDSAATLVLNIKHSTTSTTNTSSCDSLVWNGTTYTASGTFTYHTTNAAGCDSSATLVLNIKHSTTSSQSLSACDSLVWNGVTYTSSGTYTYHSTNAAGCDSAATLVLNIKHSTTSSQSVSACDSLVWNGVTYTSSGTYTYHSTNAAGCDSAATLVLNIKHSTTSSQSISACDSLVWNGTTYKTGGTYTYHTTNAAGCDSAATLVLNIKHSTTSSQSLSACDSLVWNGTTYTASGTYTYHTTNAAGCDSTATLVLNIKHPTTSTTTTSSCDSLVWNGTTYTASGTYTYHTTNAPGCDSTATLVLNIKHSTTSSQSVSACDSLVWNGTTYKTGGTYTYHTTNAAGCDSTATLVLNIKHSTTSSESVSTCDSLVWNGTTYKTGGTYTFHTTNAAGCDSTATLVLNIKQPTTSTTTTSSCDSLVWNGTTYTASGTYTYHTTNAAGCDSTATLVLNIKHSTTSTQSLSACDSLVWNGNTYTSSGTYTYHTTNAAGCDSAATLVLNIKHSTTSSQSASACDSIVWNGTTYKTGGTYMYNTTNAAGCDSTATLVLNIKHSTTSTQSVSACDSLVWNGTTYKTGGTYTYHTTNAAGCDSTATLVLNIKHPTTSTTTTSSCDSLVWNGTTYTASGTYTYHTTNAPGCDSTATLVLNIKHSTTSTQSLNACDSLVWNGTTYTTSGTYTYHTTNAAGCDSTATLVLNIKHSTTSSQSVSACDSLVWNGTTYKIGGTYTYHTTNAAGCDSTATLVLNIKQPTISTTTTSSCDSLVWNGTTYKTGGTYTYHTTNNAGCDSTATLVLNIKHSTTSSQSLSACDSLVWNGTTYKTGGTYIYHTTNAAGCDSAATLVLNIKHSTTSSQSISACDSLVWNGTTYKTGGTYTYHTTNAAGCDSSATLVLNIKHSTTSSQSLSACDSLVWNGTTYKIGGTYTYHTTNTAGCDSIATLNLTINPAIANNSISNDQTICSGTVPAILTGSTPSGGNGTYTYRWQSSTTATPGSWTNIATTQNFAPDTLTTTTFYRRYVTSGSCTVADTSNIVKVTVNLKIAYVVRANITTLVGTKPTLPTTVTVKYVDSTTATFPITWDTTGFTGNIGTFVYSVILTLAPGTCNTVTTTGTLFITVDPIIDPETENGTVSILGGIAIANVLTNDSTNGVPSTITNSVISQNGTWPTGITLNTSTGAITVASGTPLGVYPVTYQLCDKLTPANCKTVVDTVKVISRLMNLSVSKTSPAAYVIAGDSISYTITVRNNGPSTLTSGEILTIIDQPQTGLTIGSYSTTYGTYNSTNGALTLNSNFVSGQFVTLNIKARVALPYLLDSIANTVLIRLPGDEINAGDSTSRVVIDVRSMIDAVNDDFSNDSIDGAKGGATANILLNDTLNGSPITNPSNVSITLLHDGGLTGVSISTSGTVIVPIGTWEGLYTLRYQICDSTNCDSAIVLVRVKRGLQVTAIPKCINDVPYVFYKVIPNFNPTGTTPVTLTWLNGNGTLLTALAPINNAKLEDSILFAGTKPDAMGNPTSWPGWCFENGVWRQCDDGFLGVRPSAKLIISVNPTDTISFTYPPSSPACTSLPPAVSRILVNKYETSSGSYSNIGDTIMYKIVVKNTGNVNLTNITVVDSNATLINPANGSIPAIAVGDSATVTARHIITLTDMTAKVVNNTAFASGTDTGNVIVSDSSEKVTTRVGRSVSLSVKKIALTNTYNIGDTITYAITVKNNGRSALMSGEIITIIEQPAAGLHIGSYASSNGTYNATTGALILNARFDSAQSVVLTVKAKVDSTYTGDSILNSVLVKIPGDIIFTGDSTDSVKTAVLQPRAISSEMIATNTIVCEGDSAIVSVSSIRVTNPIFTWYADSLLTQKISTGNVYKFLPTTTTKFYVTVKGLNRRENQYDSSLIVIAKVNPRASAVAIIARDTSVCTGQSVAYLSVSSTGIPNPVYTWYTDSTLTTKVGTGATLNTAGVTTNTTYYITVKGDSICESKQYRTVSIIFTNCISPKIGIAKKVSAPKQRPDGSQEVTYTLVIKNYHNVPLHNVEVSDNLKHTFPLPSVFTVVGNIKATGSLFANNRFNGRTDTLLLDKNLSTLAPNATDTVQFVVRITPNEFFGPFNNTAFAFATDTNGIERTMDASSAGLNPDPNGNGDPTEDSATVLVLNKPNPKIFIPNGFSPNGDGLNDYFAINNEKGYHLHLAVYNRWGSAVYEKEDYDNSWNGAAEKGIVIGDKLPDGTYFYTLEYIDENGDAQNQSGFITLSR